MSLGIAFKGPQGIVLATDSRVTLTGQQPNSKLLGEVHYDNATKLLKVRGQDFVGAPFSQRPKTAAQNTPPEGWRAVVRCQAIYPCSLGASYPL